MSNLNKMKFPPLMSGFSADFGSDVTMQQLDGVAPRFRRIHKGTPHNVSVSWKLKYSDYQYLLAFYRVWQRSPSRPFLVDLALDDSEVKEYKAFFSPGSFKLTSKNGALFNVSAQIIVIQSDINNDMDDLIVAVGNEEQDISALMNPLEELVNVDLPNSLDNLDKRMDTISEKSQVLGVVVDVACHGEDISQMTQPLDDLVNQDLATALSTEKVKHE